MSCSKRTLINDSNEDYNPKPSAPKRKQKRKAKHATIPSRTSRKRQTRLKNSVSTGVQLLDLPREIRDMIWGFAVRSYTWITPVDKGEEEEAVEFEELAVYWPSRHKGLIDYRFLATNKQMLHEASRALVHVNLVRLQFSTGPPKVRIQRRLTYILEHANNLRLEIPLVDPKAWYLDIMTNRKPIDTLIVAITDRTGELIRRWYENKGRAKKRLRMFEAIKVRRRAEVSFEIEWSRVSRYSVSKYLLQDKGIDNQVQAFLDREVVPMMKGMG